MKGTKRVQRVIGKFANLATELDKGIGEIEEEVSFNVNIIAGLQDQNTALFATGATARNVAKNLRKIIDE